MATATLESPIANVAPPAGSAEAMFPAPDWVCLERVPVFKEHTNDAGEYYGRDELAAIVDNCNHRIGKTRDYCPLVDGHTPSPEEEAAGARQPDLLGFAGPFYLERSFEEDRPVWVITSDWHVRQENLERVRNLPRRSVEIWKTENIRDRYFDPIALLGAKTPRLDLGLVYARTRAERRVLIERYEAGFPAATNAFIPSTAGSARRNPTPEKHAMALDDTDIQRIVAALDQLDWVQWAKKGMAAEAGAAAPAPGADAPPDAGNSPPPDADADPNEKGRMAMPEGSADATSEKPTDGTVDKNARAGQPDKYKAVAIELTRRVEELEKTNRAITRQAVIDGLAEHYTFDPKKAKERAATMTDAQFNEWVADAKENYAKIPAGNMLNLGTPAPGRLAAEFSEADRNAAIELAAEKRISYADAVGQVKANKR